MSPFLAECQHDVSTRRADLWVGKCPIDIGMAVPNSSNMLSSQYLKTIFRYLHPSLYVTFLRIYSCFIFFQNQGIHTASFHCCCVYIRACVCYAWSAHRFLHIFTHRPPIFYTFSRLLSHFFYTVHGQPLTISARYTLCSHNG